MLVINAGIVSAATTPIMPRVMRTSANVKATLRFEVLPPLPSPLPRGARELALSSRTCCAILSEWDPSPVLRTPSPTKGRGDNSWPLLGLFCASISLLVRVTRLPPPRERFSNLVSSKILQYLFRHLYFNIFL